MNDLGVIHLTNGGFAVVDADLFEELDQHGWARDPKGYVYRSASIKGGGKPGKIMLHRVVNQSPPRVHTDHRNRVLIDCTRRNLRTANFHTNGANRAKGTKRIYSSQYKGVSWNKAEQRWYTSIRVNSKYIFLGAFKNEQEAATAYNCAAQTHFGEFARLNTL